jgi:large subunit ribosomal protein L18
MKVLKKRRQEGKTDYLKRIKLLKSENPRAVFRKTNKYILSQYVTSKNAQDKVVLGFSSKDLFEYGWPKEFSGSLKSIPASYLTGFLMGKSLQKEKLSTPIVDFGMYRTIHKTKLFSFLKGLIDSGVKINCDKENFPEEERIKGKNLKEDFSKHFDKIKLNLEKIK